MMFVLKERCLCVIKTSEWWIDSSIRVDYRTSAPNSKKAMPDEKLFSCMSDMTFALVDRLLATIHWPC